MINESDVIKLYNEGQSTREIAKKYNTYGNKIVRILKKHGVKLRDKSEAQKIALSSGKVSHPTKNKPRPESVKLAISKSFKETYKKLDKKKKQRKIELAKANWAAVSPEDRAKFQEKAAKAVLKAAKEGSRLEKLLIERIRKLGYTCQQHTVLCDNEKMKVDIYIPTLKLVIEIDGPSHFYPIWGEDALFKTQKADSEKNGLLISNGFCVIRVKYKARNITLGSQYEFMDKLEPILKKLESGVPENMIDRFIELEFV
jgi:very-short-patch-repair endonuclease